MPIKNWITKTTMSINVCQYQNTFTITIKFQSDTIKRLDDLVEDNVLDTTTELKREEMGVMGVTQHSLIKTYKSNCSCVAMHVHTVLSSARGPSLCKPLSNHLFLAILLISVLIISCSPISVWVGCMGGCLVSGLFPILISYPFFIQSFLKSIQPTSHQSPT